MLYRLGCKRAMVGTGRASCNPGCMNKLRNTHIVGGSFPAGKAASVLSGCLSTENADYCMLVNEWVKVTSLLIEAESASGLSFGVRAWTEMKI